MKIQRTNDNDTNLRYQCSALAKLHDELTGNLNLATTERAKSASARMCVFIVFARTCLCFSFTLTFCIVKYRWVRACFIVSWLSGPALQAQNVCSDNGYININIFCAVLCVCVCFQLNRNTKANSKFSKWNAIVWASQQSKRKGRRKMKCKTCETCAIKHTVHRTQCNFQTHFDKWITAHIHSTQDEILKQQKVMVIYSLHFDRLCPIPENLFDFEYKCAQCICVTSSTSWITKIQIRSHARTTITSQITFISLEFPRKLRYGTCEWERERKRKMSDMSIIIQKSMH